MLPLEAKEIQFVNKSVKNTKAEGVAPVSSSELKSLDKKSKLTKILINSILVSVLMGEYFPNCYYF